MPRNFYIACIVLLVLTIASCIQDKCETLVCNNGGVCVDGACACKIGFEGNRCDTNWYQKFTGVYNADDTYIKDTFGTHHQYPISLVAQTGQPDSLLISGLADSIDNVLCYRTSLNAFAFKENQVMDSIIIRNGEGNLDPTGTKITGLYTYRYVHMSTDTTVKKLDTTITVNFTWKR
jgi:hypothetical protein